MGLPQRAAAAADLAMHGGREHADPGALLELCEERFGLASGRAR
jgi:hypothetical protein